MSQTTVGPTDDITLLAEELRIAREELADAGRSEDRVLARNHELEMQLHHLSHYVAGVARRWGGSPSQPLDVVIDRALTDALVRAERAEARADRLEVDLALARAALVTASTERDAIADLTQRSLFRHGLDAVAPTGTKRRAAISRAAGPMRRS